MGIPKFFRWLSERYPLLSQPIGLNGAPPIDNLYLDMNGIIHSCTHGNDPGVQLTEEAMVLRIMNYLDKLVHLVKPQKLLFMAIDGCAPRAKMNQQRARRFRSAQEMAQARLAAERKGEPLPADAFDSNCITPGTSFMHRLAQHLRFFVRKKIETDPLWQGPHIILSGHDVPGEGEHKIMEYIRWAKRDPGYEPNQRHCMYGLDADLIMLSLVTHEPHFILLREVVQFGGQNSGQPARDIYNNPTAEHFILLHIGLLRDYLELEFQSVTGSLPFDFDLERVIDDFVLLGMLVGNDFLPPLPTLDIAEGALDSIFDIYKELLPSLGGFITNAGQLNRTRFESVLKALGEKELSVLEERARATEDFENKKQRRKKKEVAFEMAIELDEGEDDLTGRADATHALEEWKLSGRQDELAMGAALNGDEEDVEVEEPEKKVLTEATMMSEENRALMLSGQGTAALRMWKDSYYTKAGVRSDRRRIVEAYLHGIHWVLEYYYRGVASWNWYYPFHYAPCASDAVDLISVNVKFSLGKPFLPFQQLLAVLPAASCKHLPKPYHWLFTDKSSPILDFYPIDFALDYEGKRSDWEAVILIDFIDEERLLAADALVKGLSTEEEQQNKLGPMLIFKHHKDSKDKSFLTSTLPNRMSSVKVCNSRCVKKDPPPPLPAGAFGFIPVLHEATRTGSKGGIPGFPSLKSLKATTRLDRVGVQVFSQASKRESLVLCCSAPQKGLKPDEIASVILGKRCYIEWPYLKEAEVTGVSDVMATVRADVVSRHSDKERTDWAVGASIMKNEFLKKGIDIEECRLVLHVRPLEGLCLEADGTIEKRFSTKELRFPLQLALRRHPAPDTRFEPEALAAARSDSIARLSPGDKALFLGSRYYGAVATILDVASTGLDAKGQRIAAKTGGTFRISIAQSGMPATAAAAAKRIMKDINATFIPSGQVARQLSIGPRSLGMLTGNLWLKVGPDRGERIDIGLAVKDGRNSLCVPEFCKPSPNGYGWVYTASFVTMLQEYKKRFPWVIKMLEDSQEEFNYDIKDVFPDEEPAARVCLVEEVHKWLKSLPTASRPLVKTTTQVATEAAVRAVQAATPPPPAKRPSPVILEGCRPALLLPPLSKGDPLTELAGGVFELGDRVAFTGSGDGPEFGSTGCVVGIIDDAVEVMFDVDIPNGTDLHGRCIGRRGGVFLHSMLLNLSKPPGATGGSTARDTSSGPGTIQMQRPTRVEGSSHVEQPAAAEGIAVAEKAGTPVRAGTPERRAPRVPKMPEVTENGGRGFTMGRGRGLPPPSDTRPPLGAPPGAVATSPIHTRLEHWHSVGRALVAELKGTSPSAAATAMLEEALSSIGNALPQLIASPATVAKPKSLPHPASPPPPPPQAGIEAGKSLLAQLHDSAKKKKSSRKTEESATPSMAANTGDSIQAHGRTAGQNLLAQLNGVAPPPAPAPTSASNLPSHEESVSAATAALQGLLGIGKPAVKDTPTPPPPPPSAPPPSSSSGLGDVWAKLRQKHQAQAQSPTSRAEPTVPAALGAGLEGSLPLPSTSLLGVGNGNGVPEEVASTQAATENGDPKEDASQFWAMLTSAKQPPK